MRAMLFAIFDSAVACAVAMAVWSIVVPSQIFAAHNAVLECTAEGEDVTVCVHPADRSARAEIVKTVRRVFSLAPQRKRGRRYDSGRSDGYAAEVRIGSRFRDDR